jgi:predicted 3-demethylubiquinone-9 3-methyltransferase (glyoxalase superfamily)
MTSIITPCLWFDDDLEEAMDFYTRIFPDSRIGNVTRYGEGGHGTPGSVMAADFELAGLSFQAINGGPQFRFTEAISFSVSCADQAEVDRYWNALLAGGGEESMCGWLKDRFGLSWQIVPDRLFELVSDPDPARAEAATQAMLGMRKLVVADLEAAADSVTAG